MLSFDPRSVPVVAPRSATEAPVDPARLSPEALRRLFAAPPAWQPEFRREPPIAGRTAAQAAVLLPLILRPRLTVLLTQRSAQLSTHSGQIALPGGRLDPSDRDATAAALRESSEEVGLPPHRVEVLGALPTYTTGTAFEITPVVALVQSEWPRRPNPGEVDQVFEVPLDFLMDPANHRRHLFDWQGHQREWYSMPYRDGDEERFIWGATAGMLRNLYHLLRA